MKKFVSTLSIFSIFLLNVAPAYAIEGVMKPVVPRVASKTAEKMENRSEKKEIMAEKISEKLNNKADREIKRRISALNKLITKIQGIKRLTSDQKSSFKAQIQTEIKNLETLDAKIEADTDPETLKADIESIVKSYKVYSLYIPKIQLIAAADRISNVADDMSSLSAKLKTRIDAYKTGGNDATELQALLDDMNLKIADAKTQSANAISAVLPLTPDGNLENASSLRSARKMIQAGKQSLVTALQDAQKIKKGLRSTERDKNSTSSAKITDEPYISPTP